MELLKRKVLNQWERANVVCSWILGLIYESIYVGHAYSEVE